MATVDRLQGVRTSKAIKGPVVAATTANITLSGEQTIDGVALVAGDRVLVKDQTTTTENGIYVVATAAWARAADFNRADDIDQGTLVAIAQGTANGNAMWILTTENPVVAATALVFSRYADPAGVAAADASAAAAAASETAAAASETAALAAQGAAETAETNAETAQTAAETAQSGAETAETNAGASASAASSSASAASTSASEASASAAAALVSETNAAASEAAAATFDPANYVEKAGDTMTGLLTNTAGVNSTGTRQSAGIGIESFKPTILLKDNSASADDFLIQGDGNTLGIFNIPAANDDVTAGTLSARVDAAGASAPATTTIMTREKGDARYAQTVGTPVNNQIGVWTGDGTLEGDSELTWSGDALVVAPAVALDTVIAQWAPSYGVTGTRSLNLRAPDTDDANSAFRFDTGNSIAFRVDGTDRLTVNSSGIIEVTTDLEIISANPTIVFEDSDEPSVLNELSLNGAFMTVDLDMNSNTSAAGFNVDYQGDRLFGVSHLGAHVGAQVSAENRTLTLNGNDALKLPVGTTAQQPSGAEEGEIRGNSTDNVVEYFNGTSWVQLGAGGGGGWVLEDFEQPTTDVASVTFSIPAGTRAIRLHGVVGMTSANASLEVEVRDGASPWRKIGETASTGASTGRTLYFDLTISNLNDVATSDMVPCNGISAGNNVFFSSPGTNFNIGGESGVHGFSGVAEAYDEVRLIPSTGNIEGSSVSSRGIIQFEAIAA